MAGERAREGGDPPAAPPHRVRLPVNLHRWDGISFLHWAFDPADVAALVPEELTLLTLEGRAWVGMTPFTIRVRPPAVPVVPPGWAFPETNLRTYVAGPDGREGLWFLRMEVPAAWFVATLRALGLPYFRQRMSVRGDAEHGVRYRSAPRSRAGQGGHDVTVHPGRRLDPPQGDAPERFLTARWGAYHRRASVLLHTPVEHPPWVLHEAGVSTCRADALFAAAGLPAPVEVPVVHWSPGVDVKVGLPRPVAASPRAA